LFTVLCQEDSALAHNTVSYESRNRVAIITINRPETMNAISFTISRIGLKQL
tara:strand:- start:1732 stop:1887 length:156 start_codon:yes stop_codon:yes gene_type:complete